MTLWKYTAVAAVIALAGGAANAATVYHSTDDGNDPFPDPLMESLALAKCDQGVDSEITSPVVCKDWEDATDTRGAEGDYSDAFSLTYFTGFSFDWTFDPTKVSGTDSVLYPTWLAVKAGSSHYIFKITGGDLAGSASISSLTKNSISHVSFYDGMEVIPLPAAGWLLLAGVGGLAAMRRKKTA